MKIISLLFILLTLSFSTTSIYATEMSGGIYSIEVSATTSGGGQLTESLSQFNLWGALSQPTSVGKTSGTGSENLFAGVYSPVIPEPAFLLIFFGLLAVMKFRRK